MYAVGEKLFYSTYMEAKLALLTRLNTAFANSNLDAITQQKLTAWQKLIQTEIEEHSKQIANITAPFYKLSQSEQLKLAPFVDLELIECIQNSPYNWMPNKIKGEDILIRAYESALPILLLQQPTDKMMAIQKKLSDAIIKQISVYRDCGYDYHRACQFYKHETSVDNHNYYTAFRRFAYCLLHPLPDKVHLGGFTIEEVNKNFEEKNIPLLEESFSKTHPLDKEQVEALLSMAVETLLNNQNIERVLYIQFMYAWSIMRVIPLFNANPNPIGKFKQLIEEKYNSIELFHHSLSSTNQDGLDARKLLFNHIFFSDYYQTDPKFGRDGLIDHKQYTSYYGVFSQKNISFLEQFHQAALTRGKHNVPWTPDTASQSIDYDSVIVKECLSNEAVFISGPSGTYSLLIAAFEVLVHSSTLIDKQIYLQNVLGYIVGTGLHGIDEVLGPAQITMNLIANYRVEIPKEDGGTLAPNFNAFYDLACQNDPALEEIRTLSWSKLYEFCKNYFNHPQTINNNKLFKWILKNNNDQDNATLKRTVDFLLDNHMHNHLTTNPLVTSISMENLELTDCLRNHPSMHNDENEELLFIYDTLNKLKQISSYFELAFNPTDKTFMVVSKTYLDTEVDEYDSYDLSKYKGEIQTQLQELGLTSLLPPTINKPSYCIVLPKECYAEIVDTLKNISIDINQRLTTKKHLPKKNRI